MSRTIAVTFQIITIIVATLIFWVLLPVLANSALLLAFGIAATEVIFLLLRQLTRESYLQYKSARYLQLRLEHNSRPNEKRRGLLWVPGACATLMLLFFPIGTHVIHPNGHYVKHYLIPIPLNWIVFDQWVRLSEESWVNASPSDEGISRFGVTTLRRKQPVSIVSFTSTSMPSNPDFLDWTRSGAAEMSRMEVSGNLALMCWQFLPKSERALRELHYLLPDNADIWKADCVTSPEAKPGLYAHFIGRGQDLSLFYGLVQRVTPSD